ncbi:hypothetical protein SS50377_26494 [Spironucleus salmonicida]|uniref:Uncharacterized protein n=1 Tax=Spironucleus salmonicida TaxID=348837 RepID=V6LKZ2_9EUKA|nr:hypothetical protein SS50377_26494 [Spironucleus salmonicida]|eukprot:EST41349.1 Hypothetical protein SS50377_19063 [Spironucleus salmonicida]
MQIPYKTNGDMMKTPTDVIKTTQIILEMTTVKVDILKALGNKITAVLTTEANVAAVKAATSVPVYTAATLPFAVIDRNQFVREQAPAETKKAIKAQTKAFVVKGEVFQTLTFKNAPTRADVGDMFNLLVDGASGVILEQAIVDGPDCFFCVEQVREVASVFENERMK